MRKPIAVMPCQWACEPSSAIAVPTYSTDSKVLIGGNPAVLSIAFAITTQSGETGIGMVSGSTQKVFGGGAAYVRSGDDTGFVTCVNPATGTSSTVKVTISDAGQSWALAE